MNLPNVKLRGVSTVHPEQAYDNDYFIKHFDQLELESEGLMNHLGRKTRYFIDKTKESTMSMAVDAAKKVLTDTNTSPEAIDMIVFVSDTPEYTYPSNAVYLHNQLGTMNAHIVYDMNANCIGMLSAIDQVSTYLKFNTSTTTALIVSSVNVSNIARKDDTVTFPNFADGAAAIILDQTDENKGLIASNYFTDSKLSNMVQYPATGFSNIFNEEIPTAEKKLKFIPHDVSYFSDDWKRIITQMLDDNNTKLDEINHWIFSQFSRPEIEETLEKLDVDLYKYTFVGEKYGYTGVTSPLFALEHALSNGEISEGDKVVFCSVAVGYSMSCLLYQF